MADLQQSGIELVVKNAQQAIRDLKAYQSALGQQNKAVTQAAKTGSNTSQALSALNKDFSSMGKNILSQIPGVGKFSNLLGTLGTSGTAAAGGMATATASISAALPIIGAAVVATAALTAGFYAFWKIGTRGAQLQNTIEAFTNIVGGIEDTNDVLAGLRAATRGTVSDMELMRLTTAALQGQTTEFREILLRTEGGITNLGKVLDVTARAARATGQSEELIREKFLTGLRLQSKLRLDDIGVTVNAQQANEAYAKSIGKTADALTEAEKKQAFLNEAIRQLDRIGAEAPINRLQDALRRIPVAFQNIKDKIALLIQPLFAPIAQLISGIVTVIENGVNTILFILAPAFEVIGAIVTEVFSTISHIVKTFFGDFGSQAGTTLNYVIATFQLLGEALVFTIQTIGNLIRQAITLFREALSAIGAPIRNFFKSVGSNVNLNINQLAFNLGKGGAFIIGSFAAGMLKAGTYVLQAVTEIAQIVADFLVGFSPPKRGPLSSIDQGGANVAISWVDGFMGGVQSSFGQVTAYVNDRLGSIASLSRDQIETRLAMLDIALRPFKENLAIVKADMEAIAGFTDPALRMMERQRKNLLKAFGEGKIADVEQLRNLDRQIQRMKELKDFGQDQVDQAELQLSIASSQQAQQRALLNIAKDRLGVAEKAGAAAKDAAAATGKGGGAGAGEGIGGSAGLPLGGGETPDLFSTEGIDAARTAIIQAISGVAAAGSAGISEGLASSGFSEALAGLQGQGQGLATQLGRIGQSNPVQKIADKFTGLKDAVSGAFTDFQTFVTDTFTNLFGEGGSVNLSLDNFKAKLTGIFTAEDSPLILAKAKIQELATSASFNFSQILTSITTAFAPITEQFNMLFTAEDSPLMLAKQTVIDTVDSMKGKFTELKDQVHTNLMDMGLWLNALFTDPAGAVQSALTAVTRVLDEIINQFFRLTNTGSGTLSEALASLGTVLTNTLKHPVKQAVEAIANFVVNALNSVIDQYNELPLGGALEVPRLTPIILPELAKGTLAASNPFIAGENGKPELVIPSRQNPLSVFPGRATSALTAIANMMEKPAPMPQFIPQASAGIDNSNTTNVKDSYNNRNITFNSRYKQSRLEQLQLASRA